MPETHRESLVRDLQRLCVDVCCVWKTRFSTSDRESILSKRFLVCSPCFDGRSKCVSQLASYSFNAACALFFADATGSLCILGVSIKDKSHRPIGIYTLNDYTDRTDLLPINCQQHNWHMKQNLIKFRDNWEESQPGTELAFLLILAGCGTLFVFRVYFSYLLTYCV